MTGEGGAAMADKYFQELDTGRTGKLTAQQVKGLFVKSKLPADVLRQARGVRRRAPPPPWRGHGMSACSACTSPACSGDARRCG